LSALRRVVLLDNRRLRRDRKPAVIQAIRRRSFSAACEARFFRWRFSARLSEKLREFVWARSRSSEYRCEKESVDHVRGGRSGRSPSEEIALDGKLLCKIGRPGEMLGENISAGADKARTRPAFLFKAYNAPFFNNYAP